MQGWHAELEVAPGEDDDVPEGQGWHVEFEVAPMSAEKVPGRRGEGRIVTVRTEPLGDVEEGCFANESNNCDGGCSLWMPPSGARVLLRSQGRQRNDTAKGSGMQ